eukprot:TRINITY_DN286_c0_g8_i1.p1 TRINITY_DN286_c0_g8~~TRINITY_DN286_c0_g8_i1.p1  ORF type:complete len:256 (+),score=85.80 TRINITY_DN286_c0_g8_i1:93-860(+)
MMLKLFFVLVIAALSFADDFPDLCKLPNGADLSNLAGKGGTADGYFDVTDGDSNHYSFNVCSAPNLLAKCDGKTAICQKTATSTYKSCGQFDGASWTDAGEGKFVITYKNGTPTGSGNARQTELTVVCDATMTADTAKLEFISESKNPNGNYKMTFTTANACEGSDDSSSDDDSSKKEKKGGLSFGTLALILSGVGFVIYAGVGIGLNYRKGVTGPAAFPNKEFWAGIPSLVKEGCSFFASKTFKRGSGGYSEVH